MMQSRVHWWGMLVVLAVAATACTGGDPAALTADRSVPPTNDTSIASELPAPASSGESQLNAAPASFDIAVGDDERFMVGLFTEGRDGIVGGEIDMQFFYLGDQATQEATPEPVTEATGTFLPVPGKAPDEALTAPTEMVPGDAAGVYETVMDFDRAGFWGVAVRTELSDGRTLQAGATFQVAAEHQVPVVGDPAPKVDSLTVDSDAPETAIDSRAQGDAQIPDPALHEVTVAEAIDEGRPAVVVVSTPTYCVSQFCGPITETIADLSDEYRDAAEFIHIEVWEDFDELRLNDAAAAWIQTEDGGNEPWVFFVDEDGTVAQRWGNVLDEAELVDRLDALTMGEQPVRASSWPMS